jgi:hypothetical protein
VSYARPLCPVCWRPADRTHSGLNIAGHFCPARFDKWTQRTVRDFCPGSHEPFRITIKGGPE